jgi:hypothetical protein
MSLHQFTQTIILLWPVITVGAIMALLFLPTRARSGFGGVAAAILFTVACLWGVFVLFVLTVPFRGDFDRVGFWATVWPVWRDAAHWFKSPWALAGLVGYVVAGFVWAVAYFWIYARRLGQRYVLERDIWLRDHGLTSLQALTAEQRLKFDTVVRRVKNEMVYPGDFPLRPLQQKRFFAANLTLWPVTLLVYLVGDMALDVARQIWFVLRSWIWRRWVSGMAEYFADDALCREKLAVFERAQEAQA